MSTIFRFQKSQISMNRFWASQLIGPKHIEFQVCTMSFTFLHTFYIWPYLTFYSRPVIRFLWALQSWTISVELHLSMFELRFPLYLFSSLPTSLNQNIHTSHISFLSNHLLYIHEKTLLQLSNSNLYILAVYRRKCALILPLRKMY